MRSWKLLIVVFTTALIGAVVGVLITLRYFSESATTYTSIGDHQRTVLTRSGGDTALLVPEAMRFRDAAGNAVNAVVHIKVSYGPGSFSLNPLEIYYHPEARPSGSGVILTDDGYIITNNHVIENASNIEVVLHNNQRFYANVIGTDPSTDLALLKIKATDLPFMTYGNSDELIPGEWVLAIGNPFNLNSTVTAGIVSARARNINVLRERNTLSVEAFIQTDAAVNPGNSGGALVNLNGELVGINTAIATSTGSYAGYSFAIPVNLARKVIDDLLEFGKAQRGFLGVQIRDVDADVATRYHLDVNQGVMVDRVNAGSSAEGSGIHNGDVIIGIGEKSVNTVSELQELIATHRPGAEVKVIYRRNGEVHEVNSVLKDYEGRDSIERRPPKNNFEGITFREASLSQLALLNLDGGVEVHTITEGPWMVAGIREGFIVAYIDKVPVENLTTLNQLLEFKHGGILIEGYYPGGRKGTYGVEWLWPVQAD